MSEHQSLLFLLQVLLLLGLARGCGEVMRRWGYPALIGEMLVGITLGPTLFGRLFPETQQALFPADPLQRTMLETVSWFGVLFLLLETGLEVDLSAAWRQRGPALKVGIIGVLLPLVFGFVLSVGLLPDHYLADPAQRVTFALFLSTTMAISTIAVLARVLRELDLLKSDLGLLTLCGYAVNDVLAWVVFSVLLALTTQAAVTMGSIMFFLLATLVFTAGCLTLGRRAVGHTIDLLTQSLPQQPGAILTFVCCLGLFCGVVTQWIGLNALFGFFLAGIMAGEARALSERTRQIISQMVHALFVPLYFAGVGLQLDFFTNFDLVLVLFVVTVSVVGKFVGAWVGVLGTELSRADRLSVAIAFTPGGMTEIILAKVALEYQIFTAPVFVAIVIAGLTAALLMGPWLAWSIRRRQQVTIAELVLRRAVIPQLHGTTRQAVIAELCQAVAEHENMPDREVLIAAVRAREELMGTGIGDGVAIPHARLDGLTKPVLTFGRSPQGI
ncbi:MAG: PTS transporter subunit EIIA, partial [Deltaproteobacteria bacterium]|nr:PTS transporter subunit EIIA [Deltaproteobacteria bacterium]